MRRTVSADACDGDIAARSRSDFEKCRARTLFLDVMAAEDVAHGKPAPDGFLAGLGRIRLHASSTSVNLRRRMPGL